MNLCSLQIWHEVEVDGKLGNKVADPFPTVKVIYHIYKLIMTIKKGFHVDK